MPDWVRWSRSANRPEIDTSAINIAIREKLSIEISREFIVLKGATAWIRIIVGT
jgi:hypothetical protein